MKWLITPNTKVSENTMWYLGGVEALVLTLIWIFSPSSAIPSLFSVLKVAGPLWYDNLLIEWMSSIKLITVSMFYTTIISLLLAYSYRIPVCRAVVVLVTGLKAASMVGIGLAFMLLMPNGYWTKVGMMVFGLVPWFLSGMIPNITGEEIEDQCRYARTLRMGEWHILWEVIIVGTLGKTIDVFSQIFAMGWMLLTTVERLSQADGGMGVLLAAQDKFHSFPRIYFLQMVCIISGLMISYAIKKTKEQFPSLNQ